MLQRKAKWIFASIYARNGVWPENEFEGAGEAELIILPFPLAVDCTLSEFSFIIIHLSPEETKFPG